MWCHDQNYNEKNAVFTSWLKTQNKVVEGDIFGSTSCCQFVAGSGVFVVRGSLMSALEHTRSLGDQKQLQDDCSKSMTGMLRAIHLLQMPFACMECTPKVIDSEDAQKLFRQFSKETGMVVHQAVLSLHNFWPARRQRWWATISHPCLGLQPIQQIPSLAFEPKLIHLFPWFMELDDKVLHELKLDDYELEQFLSTPKGMVEHQVNQLKPMQLRLIVGVVN